MVNRFDTTDIFFKKSITICILQFVSRTTKLLIQRHSNFAALPCREKCWQKIDRSTLDRTTFISRKSDRPGFSLIDVTIDRAKKKRKKTELKDDIRGDADSGRATSSR